MIQREKVCVMSFFKKIFFTAMRKNTGRHGRTLVDYRKCYSAEAKKKLAPTDTVSAIRSRAGLLPIVSYRNFFCILTAGKVA